MQIIRDLMACPTSFKGSAVALGNFDGVHLGHQEILRQALAFARNNAVPATVMTFEPHPREFFARDKKRLRISSFQQKMQLFQELGIDAVFLVRFNAAFAAHTPEDFVEKILVGALAIRHVVTGYNFAFGKNRQGNTEYLKASSQHLGFSFSSCDAVSDAQGTPVSSSAIRQMLSLGDVKNAAALLGRPYRITGRVRSGNKAGRTLGFPTANLGLHGLFQPRYGVYAVRFRVEGDRNLYHGVANLGVRPTMGQHAPVFEVHGFDLDAQLYGKRLSVELVEYIREEKKFENIDALKSQIGIDCDHAKALLQKVEHA